MSLNPDRTAIWNLRYEGSEGPYGFNGSDGSITYRYMDESYGDLFVASIRKVSENGIDYLVMGFDTTEGIYDLYRVKE